MTIQLDRGDVLCTRGSNFVSGLIRLGAAIRGMPNTVNHVAIVDHRDEKDEWVCIEGRPGGVGWAPAAKYLRSPWTLNNGLQPKTEAQREAIVEAAQALIGRPYDWGAIALDAARAVGINLPSRWTGSWNAAQLVCSNLAAWIYYRVDLGHPHGEHGDLRTVTPGDWAAFILTHRYEAV